MFIFIVHIYFFAGVGDAQWGVLHGSITQTPANETPHQIKLAPIKSLCAIKKSIFNLTFCRFYGKLHTERNRKTHTGQDRHRIDLRTWLTH